MTPFSTDSSDSAAPHERSTARRVMRRVGATSVAVAGAAALLTATSAEGFSPMQLESALRTPAASASAAVTGGDAPAPHRLSAAELEERQLTVSRSSGRDGAVRDLVSTSNQDPRKDRVLSTSTAGSRKAGAVRVTVDPNSLDPRQVALKLMPQYGLSQSEFGCLDSLWVSESDWDMYADNPTSDALGIPQAMMTAHDMPADYATNQVTQVKWGLQYVRDSYGTACSAWSFKQANGWY